MRQAEKEVGRQHQGMDRSGVLQISEGSGGQRKTEETGCEVLCGAPTTLVVKGLVKVKKKEGLKRGVWVQCSYCGVKTWSVGIWF